MAWRRNSKKPVYGMKLWGELMRRERREDQVTGAYIRFLGPCNNFVFYWVRWRASGEFSAEEWHDPTDILKGKLWLPCGGHTVVEARTEAGRQLRGCHNTQAGGHGSSGGGEEGGGFANILQSGVESDSKRIFVLNNWKSEYQRIHRTPGSWKILWRGKGSNEVEAGWSQIVKPPVCQAGL